MPSPLRVFYSYSHKDSKLRDRLDEHLGSLRRVGLIEPWHDRRIEAGSEWDGAISEHLESADIILLLVSASFINSEYCYANEVKRALERHDAGLACVIPVLLSKCDLTHTDFRKLQFLPPDRPIGSWRNRNEALAAVAEGIRIVVERLRAKSPDAGAARPHVAESLQGSRRIPPLLPYMCNRSAQETMLREVLASARNVTPRRPFLLIAHGSRMEAHDFFLTRIERAMPRLLGMPEKPVQRLTPIAWPGSYRDASTPESIFAPRLSPSLDCDPCASMPDMARTLARDEGIAMVTSTLYTRDWGSAGPSLLRAWLRFWENWPDLPTGRALIPALSIKYQDLPLDAEIRRTLEAIDFGAYPKLSGAVLPELLPVERTEVENWVYHKDVRAFCKSPDTAAEWIRHVDRIYAGDAPIPMESLADQLKEMLLRFT